MSLPPPPNPPIFSLTAIGLGDRPPFIRDDGGRGEAGYQGSTSDCGCRAIAIATGVPYESAYQGLIRVAQRERPRGEKKRSHPRTGVFKQTMDRYLEELGWEWVPTMEIGTGCKVHVREGELPTGPIILRLSRHYAAWVDGVLRDTHDSSRDGTRCVYGYWRPA